jgi:hypothetical protein
MKQPKFIVTTIRDYLNEQVNNTKDLITIYHGGGDNISNRRLIYYTTNYKYSKWFSKHNSYNNVGEIIEKKIKPSNFLDLTQYGYGKITMYKFNDILSGANINTPQFIIDNINTGFGNFRCHIWEFFVEPDDNSDTFYIFWNDIITKYSGVNFLERNSEAPHLGTSNTFVIDSKRT